MGETRLPYSLLHTSAHQDSHWSPSQDGERQGLNIGVNLENNDAERVWTFYTVSSSSFLARKEAMECFLRQMLIARLSLFSHATSVNDDELDHVFTEHLKIFKN